MNKFFLYLIARLNPLWNILGANTRQLHLILQIKLKLDNRQPLPIWAGKPQKEKTDNHSLVLVLAALLYGGMMMAVLIFLHQHMLVALTGYFLLFIMMLGMMLVTDFTSVLIDVRDNYIILSRPVNDRTVLLARLIHIFIHLSKLVIPMTLPAAIYIFIADGIPKGGLLILLNLLSVILTVFLINLIYLLLLNVVSPARFKNIINYAQIALTVVLFASYQIFPRLLDGNILSNWDITQHRWLSFLPPFWLASVWEVVVNHHWQQTYLLPAALAVATPLLSLWIVVRFLGPSFNKKLSAINSSSGDTGKDVTRRKEIGHTTAIGWLASILSRNKTQQAAFLFCWRMVSRSRDLKLKLYPAYGYIIVFFLGYFFASKGGISTKLDFFRKGPVIISLIYFSTFIVINAMTLIRFSEKYKAAWVYYIVPINKPGQLFTGILKALLLKYFVPLYLCISILVIFARGISFLPNLFLGFVNIILINLLFARYFLTIFPFSKQWNPKQSSTSFLAIIVLLLAEGAIGILHYLIMDFTIVVVIVTALAIAANWTLLDSLRNKPWEKLPA